MADESATVQRPAVDVRGVGRSDGQQDLFVNYRVNSGGGTAKDFLLINDGTGHFTDEGEARVGELLHSAFGTAGQIHDMDGDGDLDIVKNTTLYNVAPWNSRGVLVLFNDGEGHFSNWQNLVPNASPYMFEVADFNGDGLLDLYVVDDGSDKLLTATEHVADTQLGFTTVNLGFPFFQWVWGECARRRFGLGRRPGCGGFRRGRRHPPVQQRSAHGDLRERGRNVVRPLWHDDVRLGYDVALLDINNGGHLQYEVIMSDNSAGIIGGISPTLRRVSRRTHGSPT